MRIIQDLPSLKKYVTSAENIGFVPTMGALHAGHLSLVATARQTHENVVCSIFVNPAQFNNSADLARYPRTIEADLAMLESAGVSAVFIPSVEDIYPKPTKLSLNFGDLETRLEGAFRPGHFQGVGLVVAKLFHLVQPKTAFFGLKDLQQCLVIWRLVEDLSFPVELSFLPTLREADGLAMSSRNVNLTDNERLIAPFIHQQLQAAWQSLVAGASPDTVRKAAQLAFEANSAFRLEYFDIVETESLGSVSVLPETYAIVVAAHLGKVRLIDNLLVGD